MPLQNSINANPPRKSAGTVKPPAKRSTARQALSLKVEAIRVLELSNRLHSTLDLDELFSIYQKETVTHVSYDSIRYTHPDNLYSYSQGRKKTHSCQYRLLVGGKNLGELEFSRTRRFTETETMALEYSLSSLMNPLHNALMYRQAITNATVDPLTGVRNRSTYESSMNREIAMARRYDCPLALIVLDIDRFKMINDQYGHLFGDCVLRDVAAMIQTQIRDSDMVFRYGGEEFVIMLSNTSDKGALQLAERIRQSVANMVCSYNGNSTRITVSQGIACLREAELQHELFSRADQALYQAKQNGRDRSELAS